MTLKTISIWKTPAHDGFWFKKFTFIHDRQALEVKICLQGTHVVDWMTKRKYHIDPEEPLKETATNNYRPITCLQMMWKILPTQIREEIYYSQTNL